MTDSKPTTIPDGVTPLRIVIKGDKFAIADGSHRTTVIREVLAEIAAENQARVNPRSAKE